MEWTWSFTVASVMDRARAIYWFVKPSDTRAATWRSREVSVVNRAATPGAPVR